MVRSQVCKAQLQLLKKISVHDMIQYIKLEPTCSGGSKYILNRQEQVRICSSAKGKLLKNCYRLALLQYGILEYAPVMIIYIFQNTNRTRLLVCMTVCAIATFAAHDGVIHKMSLIVQHNLRTAANFLSQGKVHNWNQSHTT